VRHDEVPSLAAERRIVGTGLLPLKGTAGAPLPDHVREAVSAAVGEHDVTPPSRGDLALREAIVRTLPAPADPEREVLITNGAMHGLSVLFRALLQPGDEVVVPTPAYFFGGLIERAGGSPVSVPSREADDWRWDVEAIERAVTRRTTTLVLCNPNNPTGYLPTRAEIDVLLELADRHGLSVVTDEAYERCIFDGELASAFGGPGVILVRSLGKSLAMPNWRIGFVAGDGEIVDRCLRELEWDVLRVGHVVQRAAAAALDGPQDWLADLADRYRRDRDAAHGVISEDHILDSTLPAATPFLFLNLGPLSAENLLAAGVAVVDGAAFGAPGYARLPFAGAAELGDELHRRLALATS
jgi:aminotransferase